tara:strand:- start:1785 stop:2024 length:240 start_codon:yes stop_codon:yes gene_type:complete
MKTVAKRRPAKATDTFWGKVTMKLKKLATHIEQSKGPSMSIDDLDYRWVDDRIRFMEYESYKLTKDEMIKANNLWNDYK